MESESGIDASTIAATPNRSARRTAPAIVLGFLERWWLTWIVLHPLPFPLSSIPFLDEAAEAAVERPSRWLVTQAARLLFGLEITIFPAGSGDTTYNYIEVSVFAAIAMLVAVGFTRRRPAGLSIHGRAWLHTYLRYHLAAVLLGYGWAKVFPNQMPYPGPDRLMNPIGETSPMGLLWTFLGVSPTYQIFSGLAEVAAGTLLLMRRSALLGALLAVAVLTNVAMLNLCYDVPVKLYSSRLALTAVTLAGPHLIGLLAFLFGHAVTPTRPLGIDIPAGWKRRTARIVKWAFTLLLALTPAWSQWQRYHAKPAPRPWHGMWRVESFVRDGVADRALPDADRWVRVGLDPSGAGAIQRARGDSVRQAMRMDGDKGTLTIRSRGSDVETVLQFRQPQLDELEISGVEGGRPILVRLRRDPVPSVLTGQRFRWINEFPFNR
jgi:hypothetical protein